MMSAMDIKESCRLCLSNGPRMNIFAVRELAHQVYSMTLVKVRMDNFH